MAVPEPRPQSPAERRCAVEAGEHPESALGGTPLALEARGRGSEGDEGERGLF